MGKEYTPRTAAAGKDTGLTETQVIDWVKRKQKMAKRDSDWEVDKEEDKALAALELQSQRAPVSMVGYRPAKWPTQHLASLYERSATAILGVRLVNFLPEQPLYIVFESQACLPHCYYSGNRYAQM